MSTAPTDLLTTGELAARLKVTPPTVREWAKAGFLPQPTIRTPRRCLWSWAAVEAHQAQLQGQGVTHE